MQRPSLPLLDSDVFNIAGDLDNCSDCAVDARGNIRFAVRCLDLTAVREAALANNANEIKTEGKALPQTSDYVTTNWENTLDPIVLKGLQPSLFAVHLSISVNTIVEILDTLRSLGVQVGSDRKASKDTLKLFPMWLKESTLKSKQTMRWSFE